MSNSEESGTQSPDFTEANSRPYVVSYVQKPKFHVGDKVYLLVSTGGGAREGPYLVASISSAGKYTLSHENGKAVENGNDLDMSRVEAV